MSDHARERLGAESGARADLGAQRLVVGRRALAEESQDAVGSFLDVITVFLTVFAIIAVIVGGFIIVNTFSILIAQRPRLFLASSWPVTALNAWPR